MSIDSDLEAMLAGWDSKPVSIGSWTGTGLLDEVDDLEQDRNGDPVLVRKTALRVAKAPFVDSTGALTLTRADTATIGGVEYSIADFRIGYNGLRGADAIDGRELTLIVRKT